MKNNVRTFYLTAPKTGEIFLQLIPLFHNQCRQLCRQFQTSAGLPLQRRVKGRAAVTLEERTGLNALSCVNIREMFRICL